MTGPLGPKIPDPPKEKPKEQEWRPVPGKPGLEVNSKGQLRTNRPLPKGSP